MAHEFVSKTGSNIVWHVAQIFVDIHINTMRDKTVIIVTHRRAALAICDYQLHIENGHMTRIGTDQKATI